MFRKVLIANRGEIAVRIVRTLREMGIASVAAFSDADRDALFVHEADESYRLGPALPADSYLNIEAIVSVAGQARVDAVHPGYGFLSENPNFVEAVTAAGLTFIGPSSQSMRLMGDKVRARETARSVGVPVAPGTTHPIRNLREALEFARGVGYPVAVKAAGGGGGRGIRVVQEPDEMAEALDRARREAEAYFKNPDVYLERYFPEPHHVEIQVVGDRHGHLVHLAERDCSVQRRHQKLIEESPSPLVDRDLRQRMGEMALRAAESAQYFSAGTVEFLVTQEREFYFLEMNTRIQVEHPVTEMVTGIDLIREMVLVAADEPLTIGSNVLDPEGHAIEVRINAEDPLNAFRPTPREITGYREAGGIGVRVDSGVYAGYTIPQHYDSLLSKLIVWAPLRDLACKRALRALGEFRVDGPQTTIPFAQSVIRHPAFAEGQISTGFVAGHMDELEASIRNMVEPGPTLHAGVSGSARAPERTFDVEVNRKLFTVRVAEVRPQKGQRGSRLQRQTQRTKHSHGNALVSPMHGTVVSVKKHPGDLVSEGETVVIIEAMKMENEVPAPRSGTVRVVSVRVGDTVESDQDLAVIE